MDVVIHPGVVAKLTRTSNRIIRTGATQAKIHPATERVLHAGGSTLVIHGTGLSGPRGPAGQDGAPGADGADGAGGLTAMRFTFASPTTSWVAVHNLAGRPMEVNLYEIDGETEKEGWPVRTDGNTVQADWYYAETGVLEIVY